MAAVVAVLVAAMAAGFSGFGFNVVAVPLLALVLPVKDAVTIGLVLGLLATGFSAILALRRDQVNLRLLIVLLIGSLPGLFVGTAVFRLLDAQSLRLMIGVLTACLPLVFMLTRLSRPRAVRTSEALSVGFVGGSFAATTGTGGPPIVVYLLATVREATKLRGTIVGHVAVVTLLALLLHAIQGQITSSQLTQSARLSPAVAVGLVLGTLLFRVAPNKVYRQSVKVILVLVSVAGLALALRWG